MLYLLTGEIQTGKTRWLEGIVGQLKHLGVETSGVLAPGVWDPCQTPSQAALDIGCKPGDRFEKLGIDNLMLPQRQRVRFATRWDLAQQADDGANPREKRGWKFFDDAISQVDAHFAYLETLCDTSGDAGFLIVDELGWMELQRGSGLAHAMSLLRRGPTPHWPHALAVVRRDLVPLAWEAFADSWPDMACISPTAEAAKELEHTLCR